MWLLSKKGFYSIVQKPWNEPENTLTIRSRVASDLENLSVDLPNMGSIIKSTDSDYPYRAVATKSDTADAIGKLVAQIEYDNFKNAVEAEQGGQRAGIYSMVWRDLTRLELIQR